MRSLPAYFTLEGVPKNWSNQRGHWSVIYREKKAWFERAVLAGTQARIQVAWDKATPDDRHIVTIVMHRVNLLDEDGCMAAIKPILDALQVEIHGKSIKLGEKRIAVPIAGAGLIWKDDRDHLMLTPPTAMQKRAKKRDAEITEVRVERAPLKGRRR